MGNTQWDQLLELKTGHENRIAVLESALQASETKLARTEYSRQALEQQVSALSAELRTLKTTRHIDSEVVQHLCDGDGSWVVAEHEEGGLVQAYTPNVEALRTAVMADARRVASEQVAA